MKSRITITIDESTLRHAEEAVADGRASSVSGWIGEALGERVERESLAEVLGQWRTEVGPPTEDETQWAIQALGLSSLMPAA